MRCRAAKGTDAPLPLLPRRKAILLPSTDNGVIHRCRTVVVGFLPNSIRCFAVFCCCRVAAVVTIVVDLVIGIVTLVVTLAIVFAAKVISTILTSCYSSSVTVIALYIVYVSW